ncbi:MAG: LamG domain-containing protein [Verrucomicrobiales bacterium]
MYLQRPRVSRAVAAVLGATALIVSDLSRFPAQAGIIHRWAFDDASGTAVPDSVGTAHGTIIDQGTPNDFQLNATSVRLAGGDKAVADYIQMPSDILTTTNLTVEAWATPHQFFNWSRVFSFGSGTGDTANAFHLAFSRETNPATQRCEFQPVGPIDGNLSTLPNVQYHYVVTWQDAAAAPPSGMISWYRDGALVGSIAAANQTPQNVNDSVMWLGRSQWGDAGANASWEEFRLYDEAIDQAQITSNFTNGPDAPPGVMVLREFSADGDFVQSGTDVQLTWDVWEAESVDITGVGTGLAASGSATVCAAGDDDL